jgi:hypothetical protein
VGSGYGECREATEGSGVTADHVTADHTELIVAATSGTVVRTTL